MADRGERRGHGGGGVTEMELRQKLAGMLAERPAWYVALLEEIAERLRRTACESVLRAGDPMPAFVLPNAEGELVFSGDLLARGPLVVCFFRGDWCPFCRATLTALEAALPEIVAQGASLAAITPDTAGLVTAAKRKLDLGYELLSDVGSAVGLQFGTVYRVPDAYVSVLQSAGIDLARRHGDPDALLPMPATFVIDRSGIIQYAHASGDITDRSEPSEIAAILQGMNASQLPEHAVRSSGSA